ncbi:hypothetical protein N0V95_008006 [Ascochyta clinopodiicola]|nr:hypothetical protein N0V95_008006 [Ascochyta clinopodiicola]
MPENTPLLGESQNGNSKNELPWSQRLRHFTWSWYEVTMSTGALATLIGQQPYKFPGVEAIAWTFAILNVILFVVFTGCITYRFSTGSVTSALPAWILPVYPFLMLGVLGSALLKNQPSNTGLPIFIGSIAFQGLGWIVAYFVLTIYVTRLVNSNLPEPSKRPAMYVATGPAAYTANTFVVLGMQAPKHIPKGFLDIDSIPVGDVFKAVGIAVGIFLWLVSFWFSALSTVGVLISLKEAHFTLNWWAFIFPNVGLVIALLKIAEALKISSVQMICSGATLILTLAWVCLAVMNVRALVRKEVLWPGQDEDMEDIDGSPEDMDGEHE